MKFVAMQEYLANMPLTSVGIILKEVNAQSQQIVESAPSQNISQGFTWHGRMKYKNKNISKGNP